MTQRTLLLVDDEMDIHSSLKFMMKEFCSEIHTAPSGKEAINILMSKEIDCIVCDVNMPEMSGVEVLKTIRKIGHLTPFIIFTAFNNDELVHETMKYGAFDYVTKPHFEDLIGSVKKALEFSSKIENKFSDGVDFMNEYQELLKEYKQQG